MAFCGGALHHRERHLGALRGHPEGADHRVTSEVEAVTERDQPALIIQRPGPELRQPLGGGGDEPARHRRLRGPRRCRLDARTDGFQGPLIAPARQPGQHRGDHVVGQQIHRRERVVGLQMHLLVDAGVVGDGAHPRPTHRDPPTAESDLAILGAVPVGAAVAVMAALRPGQIVTSASTSSPITSRPIATDAASSPSRIVAANVSSCSLTFPASRSDSAGSARSTRPTSGSSRNDDGFVCDDSFFTGGPPFSTWLVVRTPSVPHGTTEAEDRHSTSTTSGSTSPRRRATIEPEELENPDDPDSIYLISGTESERRRVVHWTLDSTWARVIAPAATETALAP